MKHDSQKEYALKLGYKVAFSNCSHAISEWVGNGPEPQLASMNIERRIMEILL